MKILNTKGSIDIIQVIIITGILGAIFIVGIFSWKEIEIAHVLSLPLANNEVNEENATETDSESSFDVNDYLNSSFKVLNLAFSTSSDYILVLATERTGKANHDSCGGLYSPADCYFFVETQSKYGVNPAPRFLTYFEGFLSEMTKFIFLDDTTVSFDSTFGDGPISSATTWHLSLESGDITKIQTVSRLYNSETGETEVEIIEY